MQENTKWNANNAKEAKMPLPDTHVPTQHSVACMHFLCIDAMPQTTKGCLSADKTHTVGIAAIVCNQTNSYMLKQCGRVWYSRTLCRKTGEGNCSSQLAQQQHCRPQQYLMHKRSLSCPQQWVLCLQLFVLWLTLCLIPERCWCRMFGLP